MNVSIFGLGYVGTVCAACLAENGHGIVGVDVSEHKVQLINAGKSPIVEAGLEELLAQGVSQNRIKAVTTAHDAVHETDISMVCVGTPSKANGDLDISYLVQVCNEIGAAIATKSAYHLVVIRSTVLPGTVMNIL